MTLVIDYERARGWEPYDVSNLHDKCGFDIRSLGPADPATGQPRTVHRVVVDTRHPRTAANWKDNLPIADIEATGPEIAAYYRQILAGQFPPGTCHETGDLWMTYAPVQGRNWLLLSILERAP